MNIETEEISMEEGFRRLRQFLSPFTGIVSAIGEIMYFPDEAPIHIVGCKFAAVGPTLGISDQRLIAGGAGFSRDDALARALGEALERYASVAVDPNRIRFATAREMGPRAIRPAEVPLFTDQQYASPNFPFTRFDEDLRTSWIEAWELPSGQPRYIPAQLVYLISPSETGEHPPLISYATSTGIALGASRQQAIFSGLMEAVERDAFICTWENRLSLPHLTWVGSHRLTSLFAKYFTVPGVRWDVMDMSEFLGIPTVLTVLRSDNPEAVALAVGAASADNIELAIIKATTEAFQTRNWARTLLQTNAGRRFRSDFSDFGAFEDHILYHTSHANATCASFLYESKVTRDISEVPSLEGRTHVERIRSASARIAARGEKVYFTDITPPDIA